MGELTSTFMPYEAKSSDRLPSLSAFLSELAGAAVVEPMCAGEEAIVVSEIKVTMPIEMVFVQEQGLMQIDASPPTQKIETTMMPVWHQVRIRVSLDNDEHRRDLLES